MVTKEAIEIYIIKEIETLDNIYYNSVDEAQAYASGKITSLMELADFFNLDIDGEDDE